MAGINITIGYVARHTPKQAGAQGRGAAIIDIAQDLLLRHLHEVGVLDALAFKGGTSLRKLYAGNEGRFSTDLDFSTVEIGADADDPLTELIAAIDGTTIGPFRYGVTERRGKWHLTYAHSLGGESGTLDSKLDLNPPPWLPPVRRGWVALPIHKQYGDPPLPELQVVQLEENLAEKISRLNRLTTARDMYDLAWAMDHASTTGHLDPDLIRRLAVLKIWADTHALTAAGSHWRVTHSSSPFDPHSWLRDRSQGEEFDAEDIGALTVPAPSAKQLSDAVRGRFQFLADLDEDERVVARAHAGDRPLVLKMLAELPGGRLADCGLY